MFTAGHISRNSFLNTHTSKHKNVWRLWNQQLRKLTARNEISTYLSAQTHETDMQFNASLLFNKSAPSHALVCVSDRMVYYHVPVIIWDEVNNHHHDTVSSVHPNPQTKGLLTWSTLPLHCSKITSISLAACTSASSPTSPDSTWRKKTTHHKNTQ